MLFHPEGQRLRAAHHEKRVERRKNRAGTVLDKSNPIRILFIIQHHDAANAIRMTAEVLGGWMDHNIDAKSELQTKIRRHEGVDTYDARDRAVRHHAASF